MDTIKLGKQTFTVDRESAHGFYLTGSRGGSYFLAQNVNTLDAYALIGSGGRHGGWWRRSGETFTAMVAL